MSRTRASALAAHKRCGTHTVGPRRWRRCRTPRACATRARATASGRRGPRLLAKGLEAATPRRDDQASELQRALLAQSTALNALTEEIRRDRGRDAPAGTGELEQLRLRFEAVERQQRETPSAAADDRLKAELLSAIKSETQARVRRRVRVWGL